MKYKYILPLIFLFLSMNSVSAQVEKVERIPGGMVYHLTLPGEPYNLDRAVYTVFIPEDIRDIRGVFIHQHGCTMEKYVKSSAYDIQYQAFAKKWSLAVVSPLLYPEAGDSCYAWIDPEKGSGPALLKVLEEVADTSGYTRLKTAPCLLWGHSGGGYWTLAMMKNYPERIIAAFSYSPAFNPAWEFPEAAAKIPLMIRHAGANDFNAPHGMCRQTAVNMFTKLRKMDGYASIAGNTEQTHNFSFVRQIAVPFYEAVLAQRLPRDPSLPMSDMDKTKAWLGDTTTLELFPAASYKGKNRTAFCVLPDSLTAVKWREYIQTGTVADLTPPLAPYEVAIHRIDATTMELTWKATADIESGIKQFRVYKNSNFIAAYPETGYQLVSANGDDAEPVRLPELRYCVTATVSDTISVSVVNHSGLESPRASAGTEQNMFGQEIEKSYPNNNKQ